MLKAITVKPTTKRMIREVISHVPKTIRYQDRVLKRYEMYV